MVDIMTLNGGRSMLACAGDCGVAFRPSRARCFCPATTGYESGPARLERQRRSPPCGDRAVHERFRRAAGGGLRENAGLAGLGSRRRPQRARLWHQRRRPGHRPVVDEGDQRRSGQAHGACRGRRAVARARQRDAGPRSGDDRRHGVEHRHRRIDPGRRPGLADGQARPDDRQPALGRRGHGRWPAAQGKR